MGAAAHRSDDNGDDDDDDDIWQQAGQRSTYGRQQARGSRGSMHSRAQKQQLWSTPHPKQNVKPPRNLPHLQRESRASSADTMFV